MISNKAICSKTELYEQYSQFYEGLVALGYNGRFGQNTFSLDASDEGVSSYLRERMLYGSAYKGFGLSAQSMSSRGVSYNVGKLSIEPKRLINSVSYPEEYTYLLPEQELAAKYLAISAYNGSFSIERLKEHDINETSMKESLDFFISKGLLFRDADRFYVTREGFVHYGTIFSLLYSRN